MALFLADRVEGGVVAYQSRLHVLLASTCVDQRSDIHDPLHGDGPPNG